MKEISSREGSILARKLLAWFDANRRPLPWRTRYAPYEVWISEVMLQQTRMERGVGYFLRWMARFPDVAAVAAASEEEILHAWEGLGYYRRARFLHAAAKAMVERHRGQIPEDPDALAALPGIGAYTVAAIRGIAFQHDVVVVDANVERVFSRLLDLDVPPRRGRAASIIRDAATCLLPPGHAREYNQALMEFGALICGKTPRCSCCPISDHCESRRRGVERQRPVPEKKAATVEVTSGHGLLILQNRVLTRKRPDEGLWAGLWEFPGGEIMGAASPEQAALKAFDELCPEFGPVRITAALGAIRHSYTNHRLTAHFYRLISETTKSDEQLAALLNSRPDLRLTECRKVGELAMPAHHRKLADRYFLGKRAHGDKPEQLTL